MHASQHTAMSPLVAALLLASSSACCCCCANPVPAPALLLAGMTTAELGREHRGWAAVWDGVRVFVRATACRQSVIWIKDWRGGEGGASIIL